MRSYIDHQLQVVFPYTLINEITCAVKNRSNTYIYGPSHSGKTELCKLCCYISDQFSSVCYISFNREHQKFSFSDHQLIILDDIHNISEEQAYELAHIFQHRDLLAEQSMIIAAGCEKRIPSKKLSAYINDTYIVLDRYNEREMMCSILKYISADHFKKYGMFTHTADISNIYDLSKDIEGAVLNIEKTVIHASEKNKTDIEEQTDITVKQFPKQTPYEFFTQQVHITDTAILIADSNVTTQRSLKNILELKNFSVLCASDIRETAHMLKQKNIDILFVDIGMLKRKEMIHKLHNISPHTIINILHSKKRANQKLQYVNSLISKPLLIDDIISSIRNILGDRYIEKKIVAQQEAEDIISAIIGDHPSMHTIRSLIPSLQTCSENIFVYGPRGSGKQHIIEHIISTVDTVITVDVLSDTLKPSYNADVLILYNVDMLKDIETLEELIYSEQCPKIIFTSHTHPDELFSHISVRERIKYTITQNRVEMKPLKDRKIDIFSLSTFLLKRVCMLQGRPIKNISEKAAIKLMRHDWPYNIDELEHILKRSVYFSENDVLTDTDILF